MRHSKVAKIISGALVAAGAASLSYLSYFRYQAMGKDAYLQQQAARFDLYMIHPTPSLLVGGVLMFAAVLVGYELLASCIAWGIDRLWPSSRAVELGVPADGPAS